MSSFNNEEGSNYGQEPPKYDPAHDPIKGFLGGIASIAAKIKAAHDNNAAEWRKRQIAIAQDYQASGMEPPADAARAVREQAALDQGKNLHDVPSTVLGGLENAAAKLNQKHAENAARYEQVPGAPKPGQPS